MAEEKSLLSIIKRYPRSKTGTATYHDSHDLEIKKDPVLNLQSVQTAGIYAFLPDKLNLEHELQKRLARKEFLTVKLDELENSFRELNRHNKAWGMLELTEYPRELQNERYIIEAQFDVNETAINTLVYRLKLGKDAEKQTDADRCLKYGLRESVQLVGDRIDTIDGQKVSYNDTGEPFINDVNSPYNGELVASYRNLAKAWKEQRKVRDLEKLMMLQEQCRQQGKPIPTGLPARSIKAVDRGSLPMMTDAYRVQLNKAEK